MQVNDFDYTLPTELIAQTPTEKRDDCRLMMVNRATGEISHRHFYDILDYLSEGDCLILNDSRVLPARLYGTKRGTGAKIEFLLIKRIQDAKGPDGRRIDGDVWETMVRPGRRLKPGDWVDFRDNFAAEILDYGKDGTRIVLFHYTGIFMERLEEAGTIPLPPYIERPAEAADRENYQTVYSHYNGSVAAPTAGLHFTEELLRRAEAKGIRLAYVTLHVGIGTFRPVKAEQVEDHTMHVEEYTVPQQAADIINETKQQGGRIVAVGTTSIRTVESAAIEEDGTWKVKAGSGSTGIFIYPGYQFKVVESLITNFHLPKSTLLMLISALYDREKILAAYQEAIDKRYRFFSYGDAMLLL